jgi:alginate O-acetyltransferase complex protein AlgI
VILVFFKYAEFLTQNCNILCALWGLPKIPEIRIHLPLGLSFFLFQAITYSVDVYRRHCLPAQQFTQVLLYISLFPQLVAGPIVRYEEIAERLKRRYTNLERVAGGLERFIIGLAKKVVIADSLGGVVDALFALPAGEIGMLTAWFAALLFALQIFFDFSGYSDMAIGIGKCLGFHFPENFNQPYRSGSMQEFWRRWHMTLSRWFRDYIYIPLGGNRRGPFRTYLNLLGVFALTGFWHGASWNFLAWGMIHGAFLLFEKLGLLKVLSHIPTIARWFYVWGVVIVAWVFFRAESIPLAGSFLSAMITPSFLGIAQIQEFAGPFVYFVMLSGVITALLPTRMWWLRHAPRTSWFIIAKTAWLLLLLAASLAFVAAQSHQPFIYFRF